MSMDIKDRLKLIMDDKGLNNGEFAKEIGVVEFAKEIGVVQSTISNIFGSRGTNPSMDVILRFHKRYPTVNLEWLLAGEGDMYNDGSPDAPQSGQPEDSGYPLFAENAINAGHGTDEAKNRKEMPSGNAPDQLKESVRQEIIYKERPPRKITEIRIFFDDNTYETFKPEK